MSNDDLKFSYRTIGDWSVPTVEFANPKSPPFCLPVFGKILPWHGDNQRWQVQIASSVKAERGVNPWDSSINRAISIGLAFHRNRQKLDIDNRIKPILDALAAGLFCENEKNPKDIETWNYDDSNFKTLLTHRLPDTDSPEAEGVAICVSSQR